MNRTNYIRFKFHQTKIKTNEHLLFWILKLNFIIINLNGYLFLLLQELRPVAARTRNRNTNPAEQSKALALKTRQLKEKLAQRAARKQTNIILKRAHNFSKGRANVFASQFQKKHDAAHNAATLAVKHHWGTFKNTKIVNYKIILQDDNYSFLCNAY